MTAYAQNTYNGEKEPNNNNMKLTITTTMLAMTIGALLLGGFFGTSAYAGFICEEYVTKFYDANANGELDEGEDIIPDWLVTITNQTDNVNTVNYELTTVCLPLVDSGNYTVSEDFDPAGDADWWNTTSKSFYYEETDQIHTDFGNVCLGEGGAHSKGFWSNTNGQYLCNNPASNEAQVISNVTGLSAITDKNGVPLVYNTWKYNSGDGVQCEDFAFAKANGKPAKGYFNQNPGNDPKYQLSQQLAAMAINNATNSVDPDSYVYCPSVVPIGGGITVNDLMILANSTLTVGTDTVLMNALQECLDDANNNINFIQPFEECEYDFDTTVTIEKIGYNSTDLPDTEIFQGDSLNYTVTVTNTGPFPAVNAVIQDVIESLGFDLGALSDCWSYNFNGGFDECVVGDILSLDSFEAYVELSSTTAQELNNTAAVWSFGPTNFDLAQDSWNVTIND